MKQKNFTDTYGDDIAVDVTSNGTQVAVFMADEPEHTVHLLPDVAIEMATHILRAAQKAKKNG